MKSLILFVILIIVSACATRSVVNENESIADSVAASRILSVSDSMISNKDIIIGGCWDYINGVYNRAGYTSKKRVTAFKSKFKGPYYDSDKIMPGDWLYFVNHSYRDIEHSAIFVRWLDRDKQIALMVNYLGERKKVPGTYKEFHLDKVYNVIRARDI